MYQNVQFEQSLIFSTYMDLSFFKVSCRWAIRFWYMIVEKSLDWCWDYFVETEKFSIYANICMYCNPWKVFYQLSYGEL